MLLEQGRGVIWGKGNLRHPMQKPSTPGEMCKKEGVI